MSSDKNRAVPEPVRWLATLAVTCLLPSFAMGEDRTVLDDTRIIGNRELPKVLYLVPWKKPLADPLGAPSYASVLDETPQPLDPKQFELGIAYGRQAQSRSAAPAPESSAVTPGRSASGPIP